MDEVDGVKAYNKGLICRNKKYKVGETAVLGAPPKICNQGFHFCLNPIDVLNYYPLNTSEFTTVKALGKIAKEPHTSYTSDSKRATDVLQIGKKLTLAQFIQASKVFLMKDKPTSYDLQNGIQNNSGRSVAYAHDRIHTVTTTPRSTLAASGNNMQILGSAEGVNMASSGNNTIMLSDGEASSLATSGHHCMLLTAGDQDNVAASGGYTSVASTGKFTQIALSGKGDVVAKGAKSRVVVSGTHSVVTLGGKDSVGVCIGRCSKIQGKLGCWITLAEWSEFSPYSLICVKSSQIDGKLLKANTMYKLVRGEFVKA